MVQKEDPERSHEKRIHKIPLDMGQGNDAGCRGHGRTGGQGASDLGGCSRNALATVPCKALEQGTCKDLKGHIFTIGTGNKGKDGDMLRTSKEKMATYIGTKYGDDAAQEWTSKKCMVLPKPTYSNAILDRHAERGQAMRDQVNLKLSSLQQKSLAIDNEIKQAPTDCKLMPEKQDVVDQILHCETKLKDEVKMKLTDDKKMAHNNAWQSHRKVTAGLKKSRGKIYSLLLGQCTQVLIDKMKQDVDLVMISDLFNPIALFKLIEKFVLKQSDNQYRMMVLIAEQLSILQLRQDDQVTNATYYDCLPQEWKSPGRQECVTILLICWIQKLWSWGRCCLSPSCWTLSRRQSSNWSSRNTLLISSSTTATRRCTPN
jgi:hypothetical protein